MKGTGQHWMSAFALLALSGVAMAGTVTLQHVHGLAYGADGRTAAATAREPGA